MTDCRHYCIAVTPKVSFLGPWRAHLSRLRRRKLSQGKRASGAVAEGAGCCGFCFVLFCFVKPSSYSRTTYTDGRGEDRENTKAEARGLRAQPRAALVRAVRVALARAAARVDGRHGADGGGGEACEEQRARAAQHRRVRWRLQALGEQQHRQHSGPVTARKKGKPQSLVCARYVLALKDWVCTPAPRMSCIKLGVACRLVCYRSLANRRRAAWLAPLWRTR